MFYLLGSLLFVMAMTIALTVMAAELSYYRNAMIAALRSLSLDGWSGEQKQRAEFHPAPSFMRPAPALMELPKPQAVA